MKSIKPGRGPSKLNALVSIFAILFGIFWTAMAARMGATFMVPFGLIFIGVATVLTVYSFKNATSENRYSIFDIVDDDEESDPLNDKFKKNNYCPYCGSALKENYEYCPSCGNKLKQ